MAGAEASTELEPTDEVPSGETYTVQFLDAEDAVTAERWSHAAGSQRLAELVEAGKEKVLSIEGVEIVDEGAAHVTVRVVKEGALEGLQKALRVLTPQAKILE